MVQNNIVTLSETVFIYCTKYNQLKTTPYVKKKKKHILTIYIHRSSSIHIYIHKHMYIDLFITIILRY